ncbi:MAG TPA: cytochrome c [Thermoanaerobaculia bacterium]|nr:cytochrome c [Thermoanaerobaculia bacterium]
MKATRIGKAALAAAVLVLTGGLWFGLSARAQEPISKQELAARGKVTFRVYCASCHGPAAKGDGTLATLLKTKPTDLTLIAKKNKGTFPVEEVRRKVDGRELVLAHGTTDMPVWGLSFQDPEKGGDQEAEVKVRLDQILAFLETIQAPAS